MIKEAGNRTKFLWYLLPCQGLALGPVPRCRGSVKGKISLYQRNLGAIALIKELPVKLKLKI